MKFKPDDRVRCIYPSVFLPFVKGEVYTVCAIWAEQHIEVIRVKELPSVTLVSADCFVFVPKDTGFVLDDMSD